MLRVDYARWGGTADDLRHVALSAPHARTRERALALYEITQGSCATRVAAASLILARAARKLLLPMADPRKVQRIA